MSLQDSNKRIVQNTGLIYLRLFVTIILGLLGSRYVLQTLGVSDYGLYNIVGALVSLFTFITGALSSSTTRFLNYELGKRENNTPYKVFNICNTIHIIYAVIVLLFSEVVGMYYIYNYLNVAQDKIQDAIYVFQLSTITASFGIVSVPFQSLFIVHESFKFCVILDTILAIMKFLLILLLLLYNGNALRLYAIFMSSMTLMQASIYIISAYKRWRNIVQWNFVKSWIDYKEIFSYINYNILGTASLIARSQGSNMLINIFFGTIVNAAYAISNSILNYVNIFLGSFDSAAAPQIVQNIGSGNKKRSFYLTHFTCRICILLMIVIYFPIVADIDLILFLWLGNNVPEGTNVLCRYALLIAVISSTSGGLTHLINGFGKIKWFKIEASILSLFCLPIGYCLYKYGNPPKTIFILFVIADIINRIIQIFLLKKICNFDSYDFIKNAYIKPLYVFGIMYLIVFLYQYILPVEITNRLFGLIVIFLSSLIVTICIGITKDERMKLYAIVKQKIRDNKNEKGD